MEIVRLPAGDVYVDLLDGDRIVHHHRNGGFEPESLAAWSEMCRGGGVAYDVGAYTGIYAIAAAKLGCEVHAFEPLPVNAERLAVNARLNAAEIAVHRCAVGDFSGTAKLRYNAQVGLTSGASLVGAGNAEKTVKVVRLDDLPRRQWVTAIKIDAERAEEQVLRGAERLIAEHMPRLLIEALDEEAVDAVTWMLPGYRMAALLDGRNMLMEPA